MKKVTALKKKAVKEAPPMHNGREITDESVTAMFNAVLRQGSLRDKNALKSAIQAVYKNTFRTWKKIEEAIEVARIIPKDAHVIGEAFQKALDNYTDKSAMFDDLTFAESTLDIFELMTSFDHKLDEISPASARALLNKAKLTLREGIGKVEGISELIKNVVEEG
jgi:hypothetical protein